MIWPICWGMPAQAFTSVIPFTPPISSLPFSPPSVSLLLSHPFLTWTDAHECFLIWLQASALGDWHKKWWTEWSRKFQSAALLLTNRLMSWCLIFVFVEPPRLAQFFCLSLLWWNHLSLLSSQPLWSTSYLVMWLSSNCTLWWHHHIIIRQNNLLHFHWVS